MQVVVGIDSAKFNLGVGVIDEVGRTLGVLDIGNGCEQWSQLLGWAGSFGEVSFIAVEGSGQYGAGVTTWLLEQGLQVREVPAHMTFQERKRKPSAGKTDPMDGIRIARVALREGDGLPLAGRDPLATDLKAAVEHREQLIRARTQQANRAHALLAVLRPGMLPAGLKLTTKQGLAHAVTLIRGDHQVRAEIVREHVAEIRSTVWSHHQDGSVAYALGR